MQDKGTVEEAEEVFAKDVKGTTNGDRKSASLERKDSNEDQNKKEVTKDGKFQFRKMKQPKKEKADKNNPSRFEGDGVSFKAKLIGVEKIPDARGDKMCQDTMQRLKLNVRNTGPHKRKISICVSLMGIKIKDEKTGDVMYHHPVASISFISQDITDARAFGYVFSASDGSHQFIAIKTEKPAFHVVLALRDLFQTVLNWKQEKMEQVKEKVDESEVTSYASIDKEKSAVQDNLVKKVPEEIKASEPENIYFDVILAEPFKLKEEEVEVPVEKKEPIQTVDELLGLQDELNKLQQGIEQMDTSIAEAAVNLGINSIEIDPFDTSFVTPGGPKRDGFPLPDLVPLTTTITTTTEARQETSTEQMYADKYAALSLMPSGPSVFENAASVSGEASTESTAVQQESSNIPDIKELEEEIKLKSNAPAKPPRKQATPDLTVFAELDPLGKDRPYKDKTEFFQDVKNPPKKVLNDLVDKSSSSGDESVSRGFDINIGSPPAMFPLDLDATSSPAVFSVAQIPFLSSSLPNSFLSNLNFSTVPLQNGINSPYNPFDNTQPDVHKPVSRLKTRASEPTFPILHSPPSKNNNQNGKVTNGLHFSNHSPSSKHPCTISNGTIENPRLTQPRSNSLSIPIPIPTKPPCLENKNNHISPSSPASHVSNSPSQTECLGQNFTEKEKGLLMIKNETNKNNKLLNGQNYSILNNTHAPVASTNNISKSPNKSQNGVSRPRPRSLLSKGNSTLSLNGLTLSSQHSNVSSPPPPSDSEIISRENMQSIAKVLLTNGYRPHSKSLPVEPQSDFKLTFCGEKNIFTQKLDPFSDDFFCSLPKKVNSHLTKTEIQEYV